MQPGRSSGGRLCLDCFVPRNMTGAGGRFSSGYVALSVISRPIIFANSILPPVLASIRHPVIASGAKQSRHRPCSPDGRQAAACAWIASCLAMTGWGTPGHICRLPAQNVIKPGFPFRKNLITSFFMIAE
ncbi:MAG: hypothetical protein LBJ47_01730 [Tannerella sp.]|nr:hypothetical protein [Tannerella sp.]